MKKHLWILLIGAPAFAIFLAALKVYYTIAIWTYQGKPQIFEVKAGESFAKINGRLYRSEFIPSAKLFYRYCKTQGLMTKFKTGRYEIKPGDTMLDVIETLTVGKSITTSVTIPEGKNLFEVAEILESKGICSKSEFINAAKNPALTKKLNIPADRFEGYLYPDTYGLTEGMPAEEVIKALVSNFNRQIKSIDFSNAPNGLNKHQIIILASIVEKETGAREERPIIAGVYHNRLERKMRLYSDPTTIYGIWESWNGNLRKKHLQEKTEYNTYRMGGLPKGPIANPGLEAIKATLSPSKHNYTYFVSKNDGTHVFTESYKEHLKAVDYWQKNRANRKGKSWRQLDKSKR
ncbi:MAG: aminodeoxychorismate lyase [Halobacteriovorax sp.]|nr:aminodeoxychorismate lyase [Halobacteriovorax sp.]|tara:strand:+ start:36486 stop:37529 length:1044 start_codon:yes stop_codon:yes gene_type:complete